MLIQYLKTWMVVFCIFCLCVVQYTYAQTDPLNLRTSVKANFGIDADIKSDTLSFNTDGHVEAGTDDWFKEPDSLGLGVIEMPSDATIDSLASGLNMSNEFRMSQPVNSTVNGNLWLDAVYLRDYYSYNNEKDKTIFGGGNDKNFNDPTTWNIKNGSVPPKNDIIDVYGHLRRPSNDPDSLWVFHAVSTRTQNGDNYVDFEYFRKHIKFEDSSQGNLISPGSEEECGHTAYSFNLMKNEYGEVIGDGEVLVDGDIILSLNYINGGTIADFRLYAWIDSNEINGLDDNDLSLSDEDFKIYNDKLGRRFEFGDGADGFEFYHCNNDPNISFGYARISLKDLSPDLIVAQDNTIDKVDAPSWKTIGIDGDVHDFYEPPTFIEFALNASLLGLDSTSSSENCSGPLGTVIVKTRASASFTSELKDLAGPFYFGNTPESETPLEIECPPMIEVQCREDVPEHDVNAIIIINSGEGGEPLVQFVNDVSDNGSCPEVITRTYSVTDGCGIILYCTQLITVIDTINPEIDDFPDVTLDCNAEWPEFLTTIWTDNCADGGSINSDTGGDITTSDDGCTQSRVYTFTATDDCENSDTETTTVSRTYDMTNPKIVNVPNFSLVGCNTPWPPFLATTWTDNCATGGVLNSNLGEANGSSQDGCIQYRLYTFTITDNCGNRDTKTTRVAREYDRTDPRIIDVTNFSLVGCNTPWPSFLTTTWTDNCATGGVLNSNLGEANGSSQDGCIQYRLYTFTITDNCGNRDTKTTRVAREYDRTDPRIIDVPNFSLVGCNTPWPSFLTTTWTDNCATGGVLNSNLGVANGSSQDGCIQYRLYTFTITDNCGNRDTKTTRVAREYDRTDPRIIDVPNFSLVGCNTPWPPFLATTWTDNCATGGVLNSNGGVANGSSQDGCIQYRLYTFTITDNCGNRDTKTMRVAREYDMTDPKIADLADYQLEGCNTGWPEFLITSWTDNCDAGGEIQSDNGVDDGTSEDGCIQFRLYTFTITDKCDNSDTETTRVSREFHELTVLADYQLEGCNTAWPDYLTTTWTVNCADGGEIQSDNGIDDGTSEDGCFQYRLYTFSVTDYCGNSVTETTRVTREYDMTNPEISDVTDYALEGCNTEWPTNLSTSWTDNCAADGNIDADGGVDGPDSADGCYQYRLYTFTVTDYCGNTDTETTRVTREYDMTNPEIHDFPDVNLDCNAEWPEFLTTTWTDNCADGGSKDSDVGGDVTTSDDGCTQSRMYTFTVTDDCENSDTETTTVSRTYDITDPEIDDFPDVTLDRNAEWPEVLTTTWSDNCADGGSIDSDAGGDVTTSDDGCTQSRVYTFTVTDDCENSDTETTIVSRDVGGSMETVRDSKCVYEDAEFDLFSYLTPGYDTNGVWAKAVGNTITLNGSLFNPSSLLDDEDNLDNDQLIDDNDQLIDDTGQPIDYIFTYTISGECSSVTKVIITLDVKCIVLCGFDEKLISSALTPNGDGINDKFNVGFDENLRGLGCTIHVQIFNRWGAKIFEDKDYKNDWQGTVQSNAIGSAGTITTGTYYYIINNKIDGVVIKTITGYFYVATE